MGYSYGGLVVKQVISPVRLLDQTPDWQQALIHARCNKPFTYIAEHTKAILFLGTPHRGSNFSVWGRLAAQALLPLGSNPSILGEVAYDSMPLLDLHRSFTATLGDDVLVFNFFEQRPTAIFRFWFIQWENFVRVTALQEFTTILTCHNIVRSRAIRNIRRTTGPPCRPSRRPFRAKQIRIEERGIRLDFVEA